MLRISFWVIILATLGLAGCKEPLSPDQIAKLKGGTTTVVVHGFCIPMDHLIQTAMTRVKLDFVVNDKIVGSMWTCSHATFKVPSGYWKAKFTQAGFIVPLSHHIFEPTFHPGKTQYLYMAPAGNSTFSGRWVSKAQSDEGIAAIKNIKQFY
ncbi:MAG: hypothetical protein ACRBCJ_08410 [Hyphomicrobiaceae bacterium]